MRLYLVQHAEAVAKEVDPDRPLSEEGRHDAERLAAFLKGAGVRASRVVHSGKTRAQQTAEILAMALAKNVSVEAIAGLNPDDPSKKFAKRLDELGDGAVIVSHLPFLARLVSRLVAGDEKHLLVSYRPGTVVCLEQDEDGIWATAWMVRPDLLRARRAG
ncbi:MAG: phosphohistidine phosphatase SixA [Chromatiales bacterium]